MEMYPEADIYTSVFFPDRSEVFEWRKIHTSFIQYIPWLNRRHKLCMLLRPWAFESFDFSGYDLVISSSSAEAKGIRLDKRVKIKEKREGFVKTENWKQKTENSWTRHICYCHTPTRYLWSHSEAYKNFLEFGRLNWLAKLVIPTAFRIMKKWDYKAAQRPDVFIANSSTTQARIAEFYDRESTVVYPFFTSNEKLKINNEKWRIINELNEWNKLNQLNVGYFMCLWRIVPYKRFDLAIEACNQLGLRLKVFTSTNNSESERLQKLSWPTIEWIFRASDSEVGEGLAHAEAFIMPQFEDFGIVALEAMSHGTPVIAYGEGGSMDTVVHGETWLFFSEQTVESLVHAIEKFRTLSWNADIIREQSMNFTEERFEEGIRKVVDEVLS